jgi:hypothetical protein
VGKTETVSDMDAKVTYLNSDWVAIRIPKAVCIIPMRVWKQGFRTGKSFKRRQQEQDREKQRKHGRMDG